MDVKGLKETLPKRSPWDPTSAERYDAVFEVVWSFPEADRPRVATHRILWAHQPPVFHDIESSVYQWNATQRSFKNLTAIATYDFYTAQDVRYLEFLSGVQVIQVPFLWNQEALTIFCEENNTPEWKESAKRIEGMIPKETHPSVSWCARIVESNFSNTSHCNIPLNILTQIRVRGDPVRFNVHNGEQLATNEFFKSNVVKNLLLPDISGSVVPRVRLPDLRQEKSFIIAHQRFRPLKMFMLDALYLGIPLIHNCDMLTEMGVPYGYKLNQIQDATNAWAKLKKDYENDKFLFNTEVHSAMRVKLVKRFSPVALSTTYNELLKRAITPKSIPKPLILHNQAKELRVHFCELWSEFVPKYNFFMYLLSWIGVTNNIRVILDSKTPNLVIYGPLSKGQEKAYPGTSKVWFTGENTPPPKDDDIVLSLGFQYSTASNYIRLPLWMIEVNWFGGDPVKIANPRPVSVQAATTVDPAILDNKRKFCAFVATNPNNNNRNVAFQIMNSWKPVDSAGRLMCNRPEGPIPAGLGGGGGELDFDPSVLALKSRNTRNQPAHGEGRRRTDTQAGGLRLIQQLHRRDRDTVERRCDRCQVSPAGFGQRHLGLRAVEQGRAEPRFQHRDLLADRAMRHEKLLGCLGEAGVACCSLKGPNRIQGWQFSHGRVGRSVGRAVLGV